MQGVFLGTFLIGLREGLEATLIVSIVAAFLKRNGHSLRPMFIGVALAVAHQPGRRRGAGPAVRLPAADAAGDARDGDRRRRGRLRDHDDHLDEPARLPAQGRAGARGPAGRVVRQLVRARRDGLPRRAQGRLRDGGLHARSGAGEPRQRCARAARRPGRHPVRRRHRGRHLLRRGTPQPRPVLPDLRRLPRPHRRGARVEHAADRARGRLGQHRPAAGRRPVGLDPDELDPRRDRDRECSASPPIPG